ncbi:MAG: asparagine synthase (glutamine-hydrolyzing) [Nitrospirota bacterium]
MCGIFGILLKDSGRRVPEGLIKQSLASMSHRGPDDEGLYISEKSLVLGLGHRRLSIIDLSDAGHQPMSNEDRSVWIVFNGEIYNFKDLRLELEKKRHRFVSRTDTEVILHSYEEWGTGCVEKLCGMFAFAIYDQRKGQLFIARDRLGIKPLYFYNDKEMFVFSSEIKAILNTKLVASEVNYDAIDFYVRLGYVPSPETMFNKIYKLRPGCYIVVDEVLTHSQEYWNLKSFKTSQMSFEEACEELRGILKRTIQNHLVSDVPLGVFLSGGLDSSTVVACMSEILDNPVKTFSVGYDDEIEVSELEYARKIARRFNTEHYEFLLKPGEFFESIKTFLYYCEEPIVESAAIALYQLSKLARSSVTVLLSGEGADELFGGYPLYWRMGSIERYYRYVRLVPWIRRNVFLRQLPEKFQKYLFWFSVPLEERYKTVSCDVVPSVRDDIYERDFRDSLDGKVEDFFRLVYSKLSDLSVLQKMLYVDTRYWLPDDLLLKADKMTMATSVELRVPFLDHKLVEFAFSLPDHFKVNRTQGKLLIKKAMEGLLPDDIIYRQKRGFPVPISKWFSSDLLSVASEILLDNRTFSRGYFKRHYIEKLLSSHKMGREDLSRRIFSLLVLEFWHRMYIDERI